MENSALSEKDLLALQALVQRLITAIEQAVAAYAGLSAPHVQLRGWNSPEPWIDRVIPNLRQKAAHIPFSLQAMTSYDLKPATMLSSDLVGLAKDLEFDTSWMPNAHREEVSRAVDEVVNLASKIYRAGYHQLKASGQI
ncbi:hypothetical protein [Azohydromonas caseinilytica]|uniref:Uncharacterized protein n=1 Tax=Azohydromonas caseinilytica TaxID=2728836 RepID=A0A848F9N0_9BURK|nr:hypothetical protein [Azohydromonas caseinilytica]NML15043.1 hypothetical protein [Azohydromonas caseinilytica]